MDAAQTIRDAIADVTALRLHRTGDPALGAAVGSVKTFQARRFRGTYADLMASPAFGPAARFFLEELYSDTDYTDRDLPVAPMLAIEVLSPSTRGIDLLLKKDRLLRAGCAHYWVVDPDEPSIVAWTLVDGAYQESARASGDDAFTVTEPFAFSATPDDLVH